MGRPIFFYFEKFSSQLFSTSRKSNFSTPATVTGDFTKMATSRLLIRSISDRSINDGPLRPVRPPSINARLTGSLVPSLNRAHIFFSFSRSARSARSSSPSRAGSFPTLPITVEECCVVETQSSTIDLADDNTVFMMIVDSILDSGRGRINHPLVARDNDSDRVHRISARIFGVNPVSSEELEACSADALSSPMTFSYTSLPPSYPKILDQLLRASLISYFTGALAKLGHREIVKYNLTHNILHDSARSLNTSLKIPFRSEPSNRLSDRTIVVSRSKFW